MLKNLIIFVYYLLNKYHHIYNHSMNFNIYCLKKLFFKILFSK